MPAVTPEGSMQILSQLVICQHEDQRYCLPRYLLSYWSSAIIPWPFLPPNDQEVSQG